LLIAAVYTIIKYPMDIIRGLMNFIRPSGYRPATIIFLPIWLIAYGLDKAFNLKIIEPEDGSFVDLSEEPYKSTHDLKFNYREGTKYLLTESEPKQAEDIIKSLIVFSNAKLNFEDFTLVRSSPTIFKCPDIIPFYDFNLLVQLASNELKSRRSYGLFRSDSLNYYCYQDPKTTHNIIGQTGEGGNFSVYTLDDLDKKIHLGINNQIQVDQFRMANELTSIQNSI